MITVLLKSHSIRPIYTTFCVENVSIPPIIGRNFRFQIPNGIIDCLIYDKQTRDMDTVQAKFVMLLQNSGKVITDVWHKDRENGEILILPK